MITRVWLGKYATWVCVVIIQNLWQDFYQSRLWCRLILKDRIYIRLSDFNFVSNSPKKRDSLLVMSFVEMTKLTSDSLTLPMVQLSTKFNTHKKRLIFCN